MQLIFSPYYLWYWAERVLIAALVYVNNEMLQLLTILEFYIQEVVFLSNKLVKMCFMIN